MSGPNAGPRAASPREPGTVNHDESPIAWLRRRKDRNGEAMISQAQFDAGERLRADFWFAQMTPRTTTNWSSLAPMQRGTAPRRGATFHRRYVRQRGGGGTARAPRPRVRWARSCRAC